MIEQLQQYHPQLQQLNGAGKWRSMESRRDEKETSMSIRMAFMILYLLMLEHFTCSDASSRVANYN